MHFRTETDSMGSVRVPTDRYWAAQTQRSLQNFKIGTELMPEEIIRALALVKKAAAIVNHQLGRLNQEKKSLIITVCDEILCGKLQEHFPLVVWQTGSGTQTNMNVNEVIANRGNRIAGKELLHPNDDVNMSQSSNDTFPSAMLIAATIALKEQLFPEINALADLLCQLEENHDGIIKSGRTHLQDATPIKFSQEISGWRKMLEKSLDMLTTSLVHIEELALGGTAVGTGLNAPRDFGKLTADVITELTGHKFLTATNKFHALTSHDGLVFVHGAIKALAANIMKIANDIRWLASGPRCGLGEITIPENEPGSSIMPGKVNPTQCEAITMVAVQVMANDLAVGFASSQGNFQLNVYMPVIIYNFLQSVRLLADGLRSFNVNCVAGLKAKQEQMQANLDKSLMTVTALNPYIGYDKAAQTASKAFQENITIKEACLALGYMTTDEFDNAFSPEKMV